jgi:hypothetical protein
MVAPSRNKHRRCDLDSIIYNQLTDRHPRAGGARSEMLHDEWFIAERQMVWRVWPSRLKPRLGLGHILGYVANNKPLVT